MKRFTLATLLALGLMVGSASATGQWAHYRDRRTGNVIVVKSQCLAAEDSASHLRLLDYSDDGGHVVIGCSRKGY